MNNLEIIAQVLFSYYELRANTKYNQLYIFIFSDFSQIKHDSNESLSHNNSTQNNFRQTRPCKTSTGKRYHENPHAKEGKYNLVKQAQEKGTTKTHMQKKGKYIINKLLFELN